MKAIVTIIGEDKVGIIARAANELAENNINILDINQTVMKQYFTMIMLVDYEKAVISLIEIQKKLEKLGEELNLSIRIQREDIFKKMHEI